MKLWAYYLEKTQTLEFGVIDDNSDIQPWEFDDEQERRASISAQVPPDKANSFIGIVWPCVYHDVKVFAKLSEDFPDNAMGMSNGAILEQDHKMMHYYHDALKRVAAATTVKAARKIAENALSNFLGDHA